MLSFIHRSVVKNMLILQIGNARDNDQNPFDHLWMCKLNCITHQGELLLINKALVAILGIHLYCNQYFISGSYLQ